MVEKNVGSRKNFPTQNSFGSKKIWVHYNQVKTLKLKNIGSNKKQAGAELGQAQIQLELGLTLIKI